MVFPYLFQENFESGVLPGAFDSETDTQGKLTSAHYTRLGSSTVREVPVRGAYAAHIDLSPGTADAYLQEALAIAAAATRWVRFYVYAQDLVLAASDRFTIFSLLSGGTTQEVVVDIRNNAGQLEILSAETGAAATVRASPLSERAYHVVELAVTIDSGVGNDGTITFFLDGFQVGTAITALDQAAIDTLRFGVTGQDAGTTAGHLLLDELVIDDTRVFPFDGRYTLPRHLTLSSHVCVGSGMLEDVYLLDAGGSDARLELYDTDRADLSAHLIMPAIILTSGYRFGQSHMTHIGTFQRGCYAVLSGTNPQAWVSLRHGAVSAGGVRDVARRRH